MDTPPAENLSPTTKLPEDDEAKQIKIDQTKDLWQNISLNVKDSAGDSSDKTVFIVGSKGAGKSTVVNRVLGSNVKTKPSTALEYRCWKKDERGTVQMAHLWELAQGEQLHSLTEVVLTAENIHTVSVVIIVDCTDPGNMWETGTKWLKRIDRRVEELYQRMRSKNSQTPDRLIERAKAKIGLDHPDMPKMRVSGLPTVLIANKVDAFKGDTTRLKLMVRAMRYLAHVYAASLIFTSEKSDDVKKLCTLLDSAAFHQRFDDDRYTNLEPERGSVVVTATKETFRQIGDAPLTNFNEFVGSGDAELDRWKAPFDEMFGAKGKSGVSATSAAEDVFQKKLYGTGPDEYGEAAVDSLRKLKDEELEQYRKTAAKKNAEKKSDEGA